MWCIKKNPSLIFIKLYPDPTWYFNFPLLLLQLAGNNHSNMENESTWCFRNLLSYPIWNWNHFECSYDPYSYCQTQPSFSFSSGRVKLIPTWSSHPPLNIYFCAPAILMSAVEQSRQLQPKLASNLVVNLDQLRPSLLGTLFFQRKAKNIV